MRYVLEGTWSGYTSKHSKVCHRTVVFDPNYCNKITSIRFTDGTTLDLTLRKCKPREKVVELEGYTSLIDKCTLRGIDSIDALHAEEMAERFKTKKDKRV